MTQEIFTLDTLKVIRPELGEIVLVGGVFDLIHIGHINHLKAAKETGKTVVVHVTSDKRVHEKKGPTRPLQPETERASIIAAIRYVDYVFIGDIPHYRQEVLDTLQPDMLFFNAEAVSPEISAYLEDIGWDASKTHIMHTEKLHHTSDIIKKIIETSQQ